MNCEVFCLRPPNLLSQGFPYYFNSGTNNQNPGSGCLRYNNIVQASTTVIYISFIAATRVNTQSYISNIGSVTNPILGQLYILKADNSGEGQVFNVTGITLYSNYAALTVSLVDEMSGPNPLVFGDGIIFSFVQAGEEGTPGGPQGFQGATGNQGFQGATGAAGGSSAPNNPTNNSFVGSGQTPTLVGATAGAGQTATCTFGTKYIAFTVSLGNEGSGFECRTTYADSVISAIDDPNNLFTNSPTGSGIYVFKSANSEVVSFRNLTGSSDVILVQAINSPITAATVWS